MKTLLAFVLLFGLASVAQAQPQDECDSLWFERNQIYKEAGYCFRTAAAIRQFGNAGCIYVDQNDVPLSNRNRARINEIVRVERALRCPR